jgi:hypothetical protein
MLCRLAGCCFQNVMPLWHCGNIKETGYGCAGWSPDLKFVTETATDRVWARAMQRAQQAVPAPTSVSWLRCEPVAGRGVPAYPARNSDAPYFAQQYVGGRRAYLLRE